LARAKRWQTKHQGLTRKEDEMEINADFDKRVVVHATTLAWVPSPMPGVERRMLDRIGGEVARATTIVRYAPESKFSRHVHTGGEEFIVLDGVFQDEHGDFPAGSYIRSPPESSHTPGSAPGCTIFVKLCQFDPNDRKHVRTDMSTLALVPATDRPGVSFAPLFEDERETVRLEQWDAGARIRAALPEGGEFLVLKGDFQEGSDVLREQSWLRVPKGGQLDAKAGTTGARVWVKTRHLRFVSPPQAA
jgi:quercetin dioxygenase-like cupin family protein